MGEAEVRLMIEVSGSQLARFEQCLEGSVFFGWNVVR